VQIPLRTTSSAEVYAANEEWRSARLPRCPLHPAGGCGFARHGSYERVTPPRLRIARWYCCQGHRTFSLLPDFLAARLPGTLALIEHCVAVSATARSVELAADALRGLDISLSSAVRWLRRRLCAVRTVRDAMSSMAAIDLCVTTSIPALRRALSADILSQLPSPVGFKPP
jgi:hypothetical protein